MLITKEKFVATLKDLQQWVDDEWEIYIALSNVGIFLDGERNDLSCNVIDLLSHLVNPIHPDLAKDDIEYFCYEINFGREYKVGCITGENGEPIDFSSAEKLYDYFSEEEKCNTKFS